MILLVYVAVIACLAYYYFTSPKVEVDDAVRSHIERCLDLIIEKNYEPIYDTYLRQQALSLDEFSGRGRLLCAYLWSGAKILHILRFIYWGSRLLY